MKNAGGIDKQWVVLAELASILVRKGKMVPEEAFFRLRLANNIITFYLLDDHSSFEVLRDAEKEISKVQMILFGLCDDELAKEYLDKMAKAIRNELDVVFPLKKTTFDTEVKKRKNIESIRIKLNKELQTEILGDLSEWYGVIFEFSKELDNTIIIEGNKDKVKNALKDFSIIWKY
ncbi:DUF2096 domain-containing protein [Methanothermococcus sp.]|uniref:DUF2096 domain-containing protein n=1 Tax=Methanothermococcus sp. TaxID=2614238 RepID=UPI0025E57481|nr:DUF2096 family protein [Methanothermococcus sp.]